MKSEPLHLRRCIQRIHEIIRKANEIFSAISHPSVCREVLLSEPGTTYILALSEVYWVSRRLESGMTARNLANEQLRHSLHEADLVWNNLLSFLVLGCSSSQMLVPACLRGTSDNHRALEEVHMAASWTCLPLMASGPMDSSTFIHDLAPDRVCGVCLAEVKHNPEGPSGNSHPVTFQDRCYHAGCANFWLNCVDSALPREA